MRLSSLLAALPTEIMSQPLDDNDPMIRGIRYDSRQIAPGDLFVAMRGANSDGHLYLERAIELGAAALLVDADSEAPNTLPARLASTTAPAIVRVPDTRRALAPIAARFFGDPALEMTLVGVTGTNGKTSTTYLVESILSQAGKRVGLVGTVEIRYPGTREVSVNTTPESLDLQRTLRAMCTEQVDAAVMEVSSHGLSLGRVSGCAFRVAAFTNLSQDHLDFHGSMDAYLASKARLFKNHLAPDAVAVLNHDDPATEKLAPVAEAAGARILRVSRSAAGGSDLHLVTSESKIDGTQATLADASGQVAVDLPLLGDFNLENLLVAAGIGRALGLSLDTIAAGVRSCPQVPGRMERVIGSGHAEPTVLVDYAHTPDAVEKLLRAVRALSEGRLIAVFGCGGDRDRTKRPLMAEAAARFADRVIATSDNPRTESPADILCDVEVGLAALDKCSPEALFEGTRASTIATDRGRYCVVEDRRAAIDLAIQGAGPHDTVVLAGKGHEDYQILGREKFPFDDRIEARRALIERAEASP